jgi:C1A family cysteine protease
MRKIKTYGWLPDLKDNRDFAYAAKPEIMATTLPTSIDLRPKCPPVYDQGQLGSCTANAIGAAFEFAEPKEVMPSRLFIYYNERVIEHTVSSDSGAMIRDGMQTVSKQGVCSETDWAYNIKKFATKPPAKAYTDGLKCTSKIYLRVTQTLNEMKGCLASADPFVFGFTVYESFESPTVTSTGIVPMPKKGESVLGGHAVLCVGYDDAKQMWLVRNSWGTSWGILGYFWMPYAYLTSTTLASDLWVLQSVNQK